MNIAASLKTFLPLPKVSLGRLALLWILAVLVLAYSVLEMAIANSLFLTEIGAGQLPQVFILIGLGSLPSYLLFSQVVDRYSRPKLFRMALGVAIALALGLRYLIHLNYPWVYYLLMVVIFFQWDFHNNILYSSLLPDYFNATEYKDNMPAIGIGQAVGILVGGVLTNLLCRFISTPDLFLVTPILMVLAIALLWWLETSQEKLIQPAGTESVGMIAALKSFPGLIQKYPLTLFLAGSSFILVILYLTTEFLWFSVYEQHFTSDELTQFLGLMRVMMSVFQIIILYCFTKPLLHWIGVSRMNVVYPLTTLVSLMSFLFNINLVTGIGLHMNGDGLYKSINTPVHQLNYNAIPQEFIGRIRTLSDGVFYSTGLTCVGVLLLFAHAYLDLRQIAWIAVSLGIVFFLLRIPMGKFYGSGLEAMLRGKTIDFTQLPKGSALPQEQSIALVRDWLKSGDLPQQIQALEMAHQLNYGEAVWDEILSLQAHGDDQIRRKIVAIWADIETSPLEENLVQLLSSDWGNHQSLALEALIARNYQFNADTLLALTEHESSEIRTLTAIALLDQGNTSALKTWAHHHFENPLCDAGGQALLRIAPYRPHSSCGAVILNRLGNSRNFAQHGLQTLVSLPVNPASQSWRLVFPYLEDQEPRVREAAFQYLGVHYPEKAFEFYSAGCSDSDLPVRKMVAQLISQSPELGIPFLQSQLKDGGEVAQNTVLASLCMMQTKQAKDILYRHLQPEFEHLKITQKWQKILPHSPAWEPLALTVFDFQDRFIQKIFFVLSQLGDETTVQAVKHALLNKEGRERANAIELLSVFKERRFTRPLLSVLETYRDPLQQQFSKDESSISSEDCTHDIEPSLVTLLEQALQDEDVWIQQGAIATLAKLSQSTLPQSLQDRFRALLKQQGSVIVHQDNPMTQILLLKKIPIFQNLTLDELQLINTEMESFQVLAQQVIYEEGSWGQFFYVIAQGHITLTKEIAEESYVLKQLGVGDYLGEVSLFDDAPHWDGAIAAEDCTLLKLEKQKFKALLMRHPRISLEICRYLSQRLRDYDNFCGVPNLPAITQES